MTVQRGFATAEYHARTARAQEEMSRRGLAALLLTTETDVRYFTGFLTRFWESPSRPWFLVVPASGRPIAVIPSIGRHLMAGTWVEDIRTWNAPDLKDDGVSLLTDVSSLSGEWKTEVLMRRSVIENRITNIVERGMADGSIRQGDPHLTVYFFMGSLNWLNAWYSEGGRLDGEQIAEQFTRQMRDGLAG